MSKNTIITVTIPENHFSETWECCNNFTGNSQVSELFLSELRQMQSILSNGNSISFTLAGFKISIPDRYFKKTNRLTFYLKNGNESYLTLYINSKPYGILLDGYSINKFPSPEFPVRLCIVKNFSAIQGIEKYSSLESLILKCSEVSNLEPLSSLTRLTNLEIVSGDKISSIDPISNLLELENVTLDNMTRIKNIDVIGHFVKLQSLVLYCGNNIKDFSPLERTKNLNFLSLASNENDAEELPFLNSLDKLEKILIGGFPRLKSLPFRKMSSLKSLSLLYSPNIDNLSDIKFLTALEELRISDFGSLKDLETIGQLKNLKSLMLNNLCNIANLANIATLKTLTHLNLSGNHKLCDIEPLRNFKNLKQIELLDCPRLQDLRPVMEMPCKVQFMDNAITQLEVAALLNAIA